MSMLVPDSDRGVYGISVAAELTGLGVQTLRLYESRGLLEPVRTEGGTRRYSADDLDRLNRIGTLVDAGLNLAGVRMVLDLQDANAALEWENSQLQSENSVLRGRHAGPDLSGRQGVDSLDDAPAGGRSDARSGGQQQRRDRGR